MDIEQNLRIMVIGECWHGSDVTGLARGFRDLGCAVDLLGTDQYFPKAHGIVPRIMKRILRRMYINQYNAGILMSAKTFNPHIVLVFKGNYVKCKTLENLKGSCNWLINFYPDVSLYAHASLDIKTFKYYDYIFTTKSFGITDLKELIGDDLRATYLKHGCDPNIHRPLKNVNTNWDCDVSFIGGWSRGKEAYIKSLDSTLHGVKLKIWGPGWIANCSTSIRDIVSGYGVFGDLYPLAVNSSRINLGLLSEMVRGASSGDLITSRTFHIPASGGFLLHQRTSEVLECYEEGKEIACFGSMKELAEKIQYYLDHEQERLAIARAGRERAMKDHKLSDRASVILDYYRKEMAETQHKNNKL